MAKEKKRKVRVDDLRSQKILLLALVGISIVFCVYSFFFESLGTTETVIDITTEFPDLFEGNNEDDFTPQAQVKLIKKRKPKGGSVDQNVYNTQFHHEVEKNLLSQKIRDDKYLVYIPHDGFTNQLISLRNAIWFSWILRRTLVLPPIFAHRESLVRGNCYNDTLAGVNSQKQLIRDGLSLMKKVKETHYSSFFDILDFTETQKYVKLLDYRNLEESEDDNIFEVVQDCCTCQNVYWSIGSILPKKFPSEFPILWVAEEFRNRTETFLVFGSLYFPSKGNIFVQFTFSEEGEFPSLKEAGNPPYRPEIVEFSKLVITKIKIESEESKVFCIHLRIGDRNFEEKSEKTIKEGIELAKSVSWLENTTPILLITDAPLEKFPEVISKLQTLSERIFTIHDFEEEVDIVQRKVGNTIESLHLESMACACADGFVGHKHSTFSRRIKEMRKVNACNLEGIQE